MTWPWIKDPLLPDEEKREMYRALLEYLPDQYRQERANYVQTAEAIQALKSNA